MCAVELANDFDQPVDVLAVIEEMTGDTYPTYVRGIAQRDQHLMLLQEREQRRIFIRAYRG